MAEGFNTDGMLEMFLYESEQLLENLENIVLEKQDEDAFSEADINEIFRTMHTIKGSSGIMMYENITKISHKLEDLFYYLRESKPDNVPHLELVEKVLKVSDFIVAELEKIKSGEEPDGDEGQIVEELEEFLNRIKGEIKDQGKDKLINAMIKISNGLLKCHIDLRKVLFVLFLQNNYFYHNLYLI